MKTVACVTYSSWTRKVRDGEGKTHIVSIAERWNPYRMLDFRYDCTCRGTQPCVHAALVKGGHCGWCRAYDIEPQTSPGKCPRCGRATEETEISDP